MTTAEKHIWYFLRNRRLDGYKFVREYPINPYIADFVCRELKVIIEIDGAQHAEAEIIEHDKKRTQFLEHCGYTVLRFWNEDVFTNIEHVLETISSFIVGKNNTG